MAESKDTYGGKRKNNPESVKAIHEYAARVRKQRAESIEAQKAGEAEAAEVAKSAEAHLGQKKASK